MYSKNRNCKTEVSLGSTVILMLRNSVEDQFILEMSCDSFTLPVFVFKEQ